MKIHDFEDLFSWADDLSVVMSERKRSDLVTQITEAKDALAANTFTIAILGKTKRGKSTLINALLGRRDDQLAPIDKLPISNTTTRFHYDPQETAVVTFRDDRRENIPYSRIREYVTEELNPENRKGVAWVDVRGPFSSIQQGVRLIDSPGAGSIHEHHDELLHAIIPYSDAIIFMVTARMPLDQAELDLLKQVKENDIEKIFFVMNKIDVSDEQDIRDGIQHNLNVLAKNGISYEFFHEISAKNAHQGCLEKSGVPGLLEDIEKFIMTQRGNVLRNRFINRVCTAVAPEQQAIEIAITSYHKSNLELDTEIKGLQARKQTIEKDCVYLENEFQRKWKLALSEFKSSIPSVQGNVLKKMDEEFKKKTTEALLAKQLPTLLNDSIKSELLPHSQKFDDTAKELCIELNASYPTITLDSTGNILTKNSQDLTFAAGAIGGSAFGVGGVSLAIAGSAQAAALAATNTAAIAGVATAADTIATLGGAGMAVDVASTFLLGVPIGASGVAAGTTVAAPTLLSTPLWMTLAGPVGLTLAGIGLLAIPFAWKLSKAKQRDKLYEATKKQIEDIFARVLKTRCGELEEVGKSILEGYRNGLERQIRDIELSLLHARDNRPSPDEILSLKTHLERLNVLISKTREWITNGMSGDK